MNKFEQLEQEAIFEHVKIHSFYLGDSTLKGLYIDGNVAINSSVNIPAEKACVLAEELGHHYTTSGNILDMDNVQNRKQEQHARMWAYNRMIGLAGIVSAYKAGCKNAFEIAEHLEVSEAFLMDTLEAYKTKYGICTRLDNYVIYFEPCLGVLELI